MLLDVYLVYLLGYDWKVMLFFLVFPIIMMLVNFAVDYFEDRY